MTIEKKLDALIDALGFDVKSSAARVSCSCINRTNQGCQACGYLGFSIVTDYKLTKRVARGVDMRKEFPNENI